MAQWPPSLKPIAKYMARAREVEQAQPLVAYYCNYYSLKQSVQLRDPNDPSTNEFIRGLLEKCDTAKQALGPDDGTHAQTLQEYALSVFERADDEDRDGRATKDTAHTFYAAMCFLEVCKVFGDLRPDLEERLRYAKWKAADIFKAVREGRTPTPGAPGDADAGSVHSQEQPNQQQQQQQHHQQDPSHEDHQQLSSIPQLPPTPPQSSYPTPLDDVPSYTLSAPDPPNDSGPHASHSGEIPSAPDISEFDSQENDGRSSTERSRPSEFSSPQRYMPNMASYPSANEPYHNRPHSDYHFHGYPEPSSSGSNAFPQAHSGGYPGEHLPFVEPSSSSSAAFQSHKPHPPGYPANPGKHSHYHEEDGHYPSNDNGPSPYPSNSVPMSHHYGSSHLHDEPTGTTSPSMLSLEDRFNAVHFGGHSGGGHNSGPSQSHGMRPTASHPHPHQPPHSYGMQPHRPPNGASQGPPSPAYPGSLRPNPHSAHSTPSSITNAPAQSMPSLQNHLPPAVSSMGAKPHMHSGQSAPPSGLPQSNSMSQLPKKNQKPSFINGSSGTPGGGGGGHGSGSSTFRPSPTNIRDAQRMARDAVSALDFQDLSTARNNLEKALRLLNGNR